jgi:hypothetical protein
LKAERSAFDARGDQHVVDLLVKRWDFIVAELAVGAQKLDVRQHAHRLQQLVALAASRVTAADEAEAQLGCEAIERNAVVDEVRVRIAVFADVVGIARARRDAEINAPGYRIELELVVGLAVRKERTHQARTGRAPHQPSPQRRFRPAVQLEVHVVRDVEVRDR